MSIYNLDFKQRLIDWLPPDKRMTKFVKFLQSLAVSIKLLGFKIFNDYKLGSAYPILESGDSYGVGEKVNYRGVVYESLTEYNITLPPDVSWRLYLPSFLGVDQRILFTSQKLSLEYAMNLRFNKTFRQPPAVSDIYITLLAIVKIDGLVGETEPYTPLLVGDNNGKYVGGTSTTRYQYGYQMQINCPAVMSTGGIEAELKQFVNTILPASIKYIVEYY
jgi:hypothetical protein